MDVHKYLATRIAAYKTSIINAIYNLSKTIRLLLHYSLQTKLQSHRHKIFMYYCKPCKSQVKVCIPVDATVPGGQCRIGVTDGSFSSLLDDE